jgi:NAD(P)-dependent dehydrogenase (short-subunit alcohol dehydrogenase family)
MMQASPALPAYKVQSTLYEPLERGMNPRIRDWRGARVWVIGASTGIGAETAKLLLEKGARVAISARKTDALQEIANNHPQAMVLPLDVTQHAQVISARDQLLAQWGGLDLMLIVAGAYNEMRVDTFDMAVVNQLLDVNLRGVFHCIDAMLPILLDEKSGSGGIGIVSSVAGYSGLPKALVYGPTKAALINLCESLYFDLHPRGHAVYLINPGFVATPATAQNDFAMPGLISAGRAAQEIVTGMEKGIFHIHFPKGFTNWLRMARLLPYRWYFSLIHKVTGL